jgi:hypothetical protein
MHRSGTIAPVAGLVLLAATGGWSAASPAASVLQARASAVPGCAARQVLRTDADLEARAARIREVEFAIADVFDIGGTDGDGVLYRVANRLHPTTQEDTLRAQLLFGPGELYRRRVLEETERSLRRLRFLYDAQVEPVRYDPGSNEVDVRVCTRDVWTLSPGVSFGRSGGENSFGFELDDYNVFGTGQRLTLARKHDVDRSSIVLSWNAPSIRGTRWQMSAGYQASSEGGRRALSATRPFYSLDTQHARGAAFVDAASHERLYRAGKPALEFAAAGRNVELWAGRSAGLEGNWTRRYRAGWTFEDHQFAAIPDGTLGNAADTVIPPDRRLSYPWIGVQWIEDGFTETHNLDQIGRTEDMNLGFDAEARVGFAAPAFGSDRNALVVSGSAGWTDSWRPEQLVSLDGSFSTRFESGGAQDTDLTLAARGYWRWSSRWMSFASLEGRWTFNLDADQQVLLGGDNGLRGFPLRFQDGTASALATIEQRLFTSWEPFDLVRVGGALFFDTGRTWGSPSASGSGPWLKDVGIGLRLGNTRSSRGNVIHVDLAMPLGGPGELDGLQLLIETKTRF